MALTTHDILCIIVVFFLPPLGVFLKVQECNADVFINICLTFLFVLPGFYHGIYICVVRPSKQ